MNCHFNHRECKVLGFEMCPYCNEKIKRIVPVQLDLTNLQKESKRAIKLNAEMEKTAAELVKVGKMLGKTKLKLYEIEMDNNTNIKNTTIRKLLNRQKRQRIKYINLLIKIKMIANE